MENIEYKIKHQKCKHEIDMDSLEFVAGKGYIGHCKKCGVAMIARRKHEVEPRKKPHMSKKERRRERRELNG